MSRSILRTASAAFLGACAVASCAGSEIRKRYPGASTASPREEAAEARARDAGTARWELFDRARAFPTASDTPFVSLGHLSGRYTARVHVSPEALDAYRTLVTTTRMPLGTVLLKLHHDAQNGRSGPVFAMQKLADERWEYVVADPDGTLRDRGRLPLCERCHAEAVADHLFGAPRRSAPSEAVPPGNRP